MQVPTMCKTKESMKHNNKIPKTLSTITTNVEKIKTLILPHLWNFHKFTTFHQCRCDGTKDENKSNMLLMLRRLQRSRSTYLLVDHWVLYLLCFLEKSWFIQKAPKTSRLHSQFWWDTFTWSSKWMMQVAKAKSERDVKIETRNHKALTLLKGYQPGY